MSRTHRLAIAVAGAMLSAGTALAQQDSTVRIDERWRAYLGCWETRTADFAGPLVCVVPTSAPGTVELVTIVSDSVLNRTSITAAGERVRVTRDGCTGWETGRFSADDRRIYTTAEFTCAGGVTQQTQSLFSMVRRDAFARVDGIRTRSGATAVRLINFTAVTVDSTDVPPDIASKLPSLQSLPTYAARIEASALLSVADVADAAQALDASVVEAWLVDRGEGVELNAKQLRALRDAKVPGSVTDLMVALANPRVFHITQGGQPDARPGVRSAISSVDCGMRPELCIGRAGRRGYAYPYGFADLFDPFFGMGYGYGRYGYNLYGAGFYNGYYGSCFNAFNCGGYGGWGNNGSGWGNGGTIVIVPQPVLPMREPGRAVNGSGYSQGGGSSDGGRGAQPSPSVSNGGGYSGGGGGANAGAGSGGGGSSNGGGSSSNGGGERTAKPRP